MSSLRVTALLCAAVSVFSPSLAPPLLAVDTQTWEHSEAADFEKGTRKGLSLSSDGHLTCHLFRHTFARHWKQRGGDIESLAQILGHASSATTVDLYGTLSIDDVQANYDRFVGDPG